MKTHPYTVIEVRREWEVETEQLGSKKKFWYALEQGERGWLFKYSRPNTGEHWSEKVAAEIANLLNIRHAKVELAICEGERGSAAESFVGDGSELIHGNQVLAGRVLGYDPGRKFRNADHTLANIWQALESVFVTPEDSARAKCQFAEYLIVDALIGNTDRHHENWGVLRERGDDRWQEVLAPSFDHASALGRELLDVGPKQSRSRLLAENRVGHYVENGRGGIHWSESDTTAPSPLQLVRTASADDPALFQKALQKAMVLDMFSLRATVDRIPEDWMSKLARDFALALVGYSLDELRKLLR
jgi:hypothetical protein